MTETTLRAVLQESVDEVLEKMFFIRSFGDPPEAVAEPEFVAEVAFEGDPSGRLALCVSTPAARSIAADFLGEEEGDLEEQQIGEVVCELANMICGSVLSRVESDSTFRLAAPVLGPPGLRSEMETLVGEGSPADATYAGVVGNGRLMVIFKTETPAWSIAEKHGF